MNLSSLLSAPTSSAAQSVAPSAGQSSGSTSSGAFDALVTAKAAMTDDSASPPSVPDDTTANLAAIVPTDLAAISAATMAMLAALDRSATMLSQPQGEGATTSIGIDEKSAGTDPASSTDLASNGPSPQTAALISAFMAIGRTLPTVVSMPEENTSDADAALPRASSAPKAAPPPLPATTVAMPALFNAIASELRPLLNAGADLAAKALDATVEPVKESTKKLSVVSPTSAMIRELASMIASNVTPAAPADGVVVDRHLDLARGDAWLNELANDIAATAANGGRLKFGLAPESLGRLDVEIRQGEAGVNVHMTTRTDTARDILTAAQPRIVDEIRAQGVRVAGTEVSTDASGSGSGFGGDRAGTHARAMPIEAALSALDAALPEPPKSVADGRYA